MNEPHLQRALMAALDANERHLETRRRFAEWVRIRKIATDSTRGGGTEASDSVMQEHIDDRRADSYLAEFDALTARLTSDLHRYAVLYGIAHPAPPQRALNITTDDDWCRSCARIKVASPRTAGTLCSFCWSYKKDTTRLPPLDILRRRHAGMPIRAN